MDFFKIENRKYLGSKHRLLGFIEQTIQERVKSIAVFIDGFSGTGAVANHFKSRAGKVIANDLLYSNYVINKAFLNSSVKTVDMDKLKEIISGLNSTDGNCGYVTRNYGGTYFTLQNAQRIDAIREKIESLCISRICTLQEKYILLTSLLFAVDKAANTIGQYDAYLKHIGNEVYDNNGVHKIDSNVYKPLNLKIPLLEGAPHHEVYNEDINHLAPQIQGDVLYLDPPYNHRQYIDNYHVLENIVLWNKPPLSGKTCKFKRDYLKSRYSRKREAALALQDLVAKTRVNHIFLSYNNEGIIPGEIITRILHTRGEVSSYEQDYPVFGNGAGRSARRSIIERIYYCRCRGNNPL